MKHVEPQVYIIARTAIDPDAARQWLDAIGAEDYDLPDGTDAERLVMLAGKRCYKSFVAGMNPNVTRTRSDMKDFIDNILSSRHGSVLEHVTYTFALENVSRVLTAELNRHRAGVAISEGSLRYIRFDDIPFWMPASIQDAVNDSEELRTAKAETRRVFWRAFQQMEKNYEDLENIWRIDTLKDFKKKKKLTSMFRRIIGMGVATGGVWTGNIRALRHILALRVRPEAEEEIALVCGLMLKKMTEAEPLLFGDFHADADGIITPDFAKI